MSLSTRDGKKALRLQRICDYGALTEWSIVQVCKTSVHGFESHGRLIKLCLNWANSSVLYTNPCELYSLLSWVSVRHSAFFVVYRNSLAVVMIDITSSSQCTITTESEYTAALHTWGGRCSMYCNATIYSDFYYLLLSLPKGSLLR